MLLFSCMLTATLGKVNHGFFHFFTAILETASHLLGTSLRLKISSPNFTIYDDELTWIRLLRNVLHSYQSERSPIPAPRLLCSTSECPPLGLRAPMETAHKNSRCTMLAFQLLQMKPTIGSNVQKTFIYVYWL